MNELAVAYPSWHPHVDVWLLVAAISLYLIVLTTLHVFSPS